MIAVALLQDSAGVYDGRANRIHIDVPRIDTVVNIDGSLDEPVWRRAARLDGFSQYQPVDGRPADEPTEVLVWYAPDAIYFGIRARELHGNVVRATHANRDNIDSEDQIQILLDTDNSRQIAFLFGVNPYGVQQDGTRSAQFAGGAGGASATGGGFRNINPLEGSVDLNPDYFFESKGRLVDGGYEVEMRIPFKSLRYQDARVQSWGLHILRRVQHSGFQDTWAPAIRANANFLAQSGTLDGLHDLRRGLVLEATPTMTAHADRSPTLGNGRDYQKKADIGGDVRLGNQAESHPQRNDQSRLLAGRSRRRAGAAQRAIRAVLSGEATVLSRWTRAVRLAQPADIHTTDRRAERGRQADGEARRDRTSRRLSPPTTSSIPGQARTRRSLASSRLRYDFGSNNTLGAVLTAREDGADFSRVAAADFRFYHSKLYFAQFQAAQSWTDSSRNHLNGSLLQGDWDRTGRAWGFHYTLRSLAPDFRAASGFVNRTGIIETRAFNRLSFYGAQGALVQTYSTFFGLDRIWNNGGSGHGLAEGTESITPTATIRGGWQLSGALTHSYFAFDPSLYAGLTVQQSTGAVVDIRRRSWYRSEKNELGGSLSLTTPTYRHFGGTASITRGQVPIFREAAPGNSFAH